MEILVTLSIIPYLKILYQPMGPPTTPGPQAPHQLNPALRTQPSNVPHQAEYSDFALLTDFRNKSSTKLSCM